MPEVRLGPWEALRSDAQAVRIAVFIDEQGIPADLEWDDADAHALHALAVHGAGEPVATGRLLRHVDGIARIGRMAVLKAHRGHGIGRAVLDALMRAARERGEAEVVLHAQQLAIPFYANAGFIRRGPVFEEAGIPHVAMVCLL